MSEENKTKDLPEPGNESNKANEELAQTQNSAAVTDSDTLQKKEENNTSSESSMRYAPSENVEPTGLQELSVTNPIQACSDIFVKPSEVFRSLAVKDNWSWVPFLLVSVIAVLPAYLYFGVVDFDWYVDSQLASMAAESAPAQVEAQRAMMGTAETSRFFSVIFIPISLIVISALAALYFTVMTRNDEKSIHSFFDWYGVQWWTMMPYIIGAVVSLAILVMQDPGVQLSPAVMAPLSLGYVFGLDAGDKWLTFMNEIRIDRIWGVFLTAYCLQQWTNFSKTKSFVVAAIPSLLVLLIALGAALIA